MPTRASPQKNTRAETMDNIHGISSFLVHTYSFILNQYYKCNDYDIMKSMDLEEMGIHTVNDFTHA